MQSGLFYSSYTRQKKSEKVMAKSSNEGDIPEFDFEPRFPEHLRETMSKLPLRQQQLLYLDIFKPLDFYELLFKRFKESGEEQSKAEEICAVTDKCHRQK